ncbi:MAG: ribbon-helix-helix protein, CopG family [Propionibacteriaceae bacterium]|jgi:hypothetical protein|nr:ribbon-helix-helix protein, CopG family [Propionibacteriaceae bacterium]
MTDSMNPPASVYDTVDLETEQFYDTAGHRITEESNQRLVEEVHRTIGRPSLTGPGQHSPQLNLRLSEPVNARLVSLAERSGKRKSDIVREALIRYLDDTEPELAQAA